MPSCSQLESSETTAVNAAAALAAQIANDKPDVSVARIACFSDTGVPSPLTYSSAMNRLTQLQAAQPPNTTLIEKYQDLLDVLGPYNAKIQERETNLAVAEAIHDQRVAQSCPGV